jgi:hypothetical protein
MGGGGDARGRRRWLDRLLNLVAAVAAGLAVYFLATERVIPALRGEPARAVPGEALPAKLALEPLGAASGRKIVVPAGAPALLLVFNSSCPACYANLPAWREALAAATGDVRVLAVGLQSDRRAARAYVRHELPGAEPVMPGDARFFVGTLGVEYVPFTVLVDGDGVVRFLRQGRLDPAATTALRGALEALAGSSP